MSGRSIPEQLHEYVDTTLFDYETTDHLDASLVHVDDRFDHRFALHGQVVRCVVATFYLGGKFLGYDRLVWSKSLPRRFLPRPRTPLFRQSLR